MKIRYMSDLHLEGTAMGIGNPEGHDVLVLAGDIGVQGCDKEFMRRAKGMFPHVLRVLGNHEYYRGDFIETVRIYEALCASAGVTLLHRQQVHIGGVQFIGATMWTDFRNGNALDMLRASQFMRDYEVIKINGRRLSPEDTLREHYKDVTYLRSTLSNPAWTDKRVVITHHCPGVQYTAPWYQSTPETSAFVSDQPRLVSKANVWIFGHTHYNIYTTTESGTRVVSNQRGYRHEYANIGFDPYAHIEL